jgi:hypothetical protein
VCVRVRVYKTVDGMRCLRKVGNKTMLLSFFSVRYLDNDINTFEKSGGQFEVFCISVQFVLEGNCLFPCFCSLASGHI